MTVVSSPAHVNVMGDLMKMPDGSVLISSQAFTQHAVSPSMPQNMMQPLFNQSGVIFNSPAAQQMPFQQPSASLSGLAIQQPTFGPGMATFGVSASQVVSDPNMLSSQCLPLLQSSTQSFNQKTTPTSTTSPAPTASSQFPSPLKKAADLADKPSFSVIPQDFGQSMGSNAAWSNYLTQSTFYGNPGNWPWVIGYHYFCFF